MNLMADSSTGALNSAGDHPPTILVVDDEAMIRQLLRWILAHLGYNVLSAPNGAEALAIAARTDSFHILMTDLNLPGMSGVELADELRATRPELMTLFISGSSREEFEDLGIDMSQSTFIPKPFSLPQVSEAIGALTEREALGVLR